MLLDFGRTISRKARTQNGTDALGNPIYDLGAAGNLTAIIQDLRTDDKRIVAGILQVGDVEAFVAGTVTLDPLDELTLDSKRYRIVEETTPAYGDDPTRPYKSYILRRVAA